MKKQDISNIIKDVRNSHDSWMIQGRIILDGINLDRVEEPVDHTECCFGQWCESNKNKILALPPLEQLEQLHQEFHETYKHLFFDSMRKYNPCTMDQLLERFEALKDTSAEFNTKLNEVEAELFSLSDEGFDELIEKSIRSYEQNIKNNSSECSSKCSSNNKASDESADEATINEVTENETTEVNADIEFEDPNSEIEFEEFQLDDTDTISPNNEKSSKEGQDMQDIDINEYEVIDQNPFDELESVNPVIIKPQNNLDKLSKKDEPIEVSEKVSFAKPDQSKIKNADVLLELVQPMNRMISLKEQNIIQLKEEKELTKLELAHIESTQDLTQKSLDQLEKYFILKQQEIDVEQENNSNFLDFKNKAKTEIEEELTEIKDKKSSLKNDIQDLEKKNVEDDIKLEETNKKGVIEKQFEELKRNKNISLNDLLDHKKVRENDLAKLKEQVLLIEEEISEVNDNIDKKQKDLLDLEEKESLKNSERNKQKEEIAIVQAERNETITNIQKEFDSLDEDQQVKQIELDTINFQVEELNKNNSLVESNNSDEIKDLVLQQEKKQEKLSETEKLKQSKQSEITDIDLRIVAVERSLEKLKLESADEADDSIIKDEELLAVD